MAKFTYKMQNILNVKEKLEEQAKISYGIANAKLHEEEDKLRELMARRGQYEARAKELVSGRIDVREIASCRKAIDTMKSLIRKQMLAVNVAEKNVEAARQKLAEVMVERKTHEKLREHAFEEFKQELAYEENKSVDELVSYTYHRNGEA